MMSDWKRPIDALSSEGVKELRRLQAENVKLREMCRDLVGELRGLGIDFTRVSWCEYADELRELGIEVDA